MPKLVPIVEGDGEVNAVPILLYKLLHELQRYDIHVAESKPAYGRDNLLKPGGIEKFIRYAWKEPDCGAILVLLDADEDCPLVLAQALARRITTLGLFHPVVIVCIQPMYETWLLASLTTLVGQAGLPANLASPLSVETIKNPKAWLRERFPKERPYKESRDQETLTRLLDVEQARINSASFRRLCRAVTEAIAAIESGAKIVTPAFPEPTTTPNHPGSKAKS